MSMHLRIEGKWYKSLEVALSWYSMASPHELVVDGGSLARIAIGQHGSAAIKEELKNRVITSLKVEHSRMPVAKPREVFAREQEHNAPLGAVAEAPLEPVQAQSNL